MLLLHTFTKAVVVVLLLMLLLLLLLLFPHNLPARSSAVFQSTTCVSPRVSVLLHHNCCGALHWEWDKSVEHFCGSIASERILIVKLYFGTLLLNSVFGSWVIALLHQRTLRSMWSTLKRIFRTTKHYHKAIYGRALCLEVILWSNILEHYYMEQYFGALLYRAIFWSTTI